MNKLTVMTVDDEPLALRRLQLALTEIPGFTHVAEASGCGEGLSRFAEHRPDIVIVDVMMRDGTGFDLVEKLAPSRPPAVIFATAFDRFAVRAFETSATDYVLKPIEIPRLRGALHRARARLAESAAAGTVGELNAVVDNLRRSLCNQESNPNRDVWVRGSHGAMTRVNLAEVQLVTSEDDYVRLHLGARSFLVRLSIRALADRVPANEFIRVHRTALVRRSAIVDVVRSGSRVSAILPDGRSIEAGRIFARDLLAMVKAERLD